MSKEASIVTPHLVTSNALCLLAPREGFGASSAVRIGDRRGDLVRPRSRAVDDQLERPRVRVDNEPMDERFSDVGGRVSVAPLQGLQHRGMRT